VLRRLLAPAIAFLRLPVGERAARVPVKVAVGVAVGLFAFFTALAFTPAGRTLERKGFDELTVASARPQQLPITLIGIDDASLAEVGRQFPWPRSTHAKLIRTLNEAGAMVIVFDMLFAEPATDPAEDQALAQAIAEAGNVVIVASSTFQESAYFRQWSRIDPTPALLAAKPGVGLANVSPDRDTIVRDMPEGKDVLWREIVRRANAVRPGMLVEPNDLHGALIRYAQTGAEGAYPYVSYYQALSPDTHLPKGAFQDQIVLVGLRLTASLSAAMGTQDTFATPFTSETGLVTPGVELHAHILESAITGRAVVPLGMQVQLTVLALVTILSSLLMRRWRPVLSAIVALAIAALVIGPAYWSFSVHSRWLPGVGILAAIAASYFVYGAIGYLGERQRRSEIKRAFELYVAPEVVDHMLSQPGRLTFGGERRTITVFFSDLAGFTSISEKHGPEVVGRVLKQHFTRTTAIAKKHRGTVIQFAGDGLMAIWGAPLSDPDHAANACQAAREMQSDMEVLRRELEEQGLPTIHMRIGLHTCEAIVGNFGSATHFYYSALGDGVNLASRLEGANKAFGSRILMSASAVAGLPAGQPLRPLASVIVKGKSEPVDVFTFEEDADVREHTVRGLAAFGRREWDEAQGAFEAILARREDDLASKRYLGRIAALRSEPPPETWTPAESLDKM
jgi:adenylate cyclase